MWLYLAIKVQIQLWNYWARTKTGLKSFQYIFDNVRIVFNMLFLVLGFKELFLLVLILDACWHTRTQMTSSSVFWAEFEHGQHQKSASHQRNFPLSWDYHLVPDPRKRYDFIWVKAPTSKRQFTSIPATLPQSCKISSH